ncbi:MAG: enoyl-CoA hydratase/isomerase family protein, partial [Proteobacteria bacterium]|nr:enoyl-CoA hydratase/isomerase family protein [Pseudomonadota bacterium]
ITIDNQPKRNAMSREMLGELAGAWDRLAADAGCRAIVITGAGEKGFCAGADIGGDLSVAPETADMVNRALLKTTVFPKPIIAAVNGDCAGGGVELLLSTDIRGACPTARFGLPEVRFAIYPFGGATVKLIQQIGHVHAMDLILTGRLIDAATAMRLGLVNEVVAQAELMDWAMGRARLIAANSPAAVQAVKTQISTTIAEHARALEPLEQSLGDRVRASADFKEGIAAFLEKRKPSYR